MVINKIYNKKKYIINKKVFYNINIYMKTFLMLLIVILLGILASFYVKTNPRIVFVTPSMPIWRGPAIKYPNPPARWGYRTLCRKRLNC